MQNNTTGKREDVIQRAYRMRLYPTDVQKILMAKTFGCCRFVYNRFLAQRKQAYEERKKTPSYVEQCHELVLLKKEEETAWLGEVDSMALQNACRNLQAAYDNFFRRFSKGKKTGYPRLKRKRESRQSYRTTCINNNIRITDGSHMQLPKLGTVRCRVTRPVEGRILNATVVREPDGKYYVSVVAEVPKPESLPKTGKSVGVDLGIKTLLVTSDGKEYPNAKNYQKTEKRLKREQRKLSGKQTGSKNRERQRLKVAKLQGRVRRQRLDAIHKMTTELVKEYDVICMEDLNVRGMMQSHLLAKTVGDASFGEIERQLQYKCEWYGKELRKADTFYPSSQLCSVCGYRNRETKDLDVREWVCPRCGTKHDRDVNAARNILHECMEQDSA